MQGREINYYRAGVADKARLIMSYLLRRLVALNSRSIQDLKFLIQSFHSVVEGEFIMHSKTKANNLLNECLQCKMNILSEGDQKQSSS